MKKQIFKTKIPFIFLMLTIILIGSSCTEDDVVVPPDSYACENKGLYYTIDSGQEIYIQETADTINTNIYTHSTGALGDNIMLHQLGNGYVFQSNATDVGQNSTHVVGISTEGTQLSIGNLWANTDVVNINYSCKKMEDIINGMVYYEFEGNYTTLGVTHQIAGYICGVFDTVN